MIPWSRTEVSTILSMSPCRESLRLAAELRSLLRIATPTYYPVGRKMVLARSIQIGVHSTVNYNGQRPQRHTAARAVSSGGGRVHNARFPGKISGAARI
jgi:hypothetical protein